MKTTNEVAAMLGLTESVVQKYAKELGIGKVGNAYAWGAGNVKALESYIEAKRIQANEVRVGNFRAQEPAVFNTPITPSKLYSDEYKHRDPWRSSGTPQTYKPRGFCPTMVTAEGRREFRREVV